MAFQFISSKNKLSFLMMISSPYKTAEHSWNQTNLFYRDQMRQIYEQDVIAMKNIIHSEIKAIVI